MQVLSVDHSWVDSQVLSVTDSTTSDFSISSCEGEVWPEIPVLHSSNVKMFHLFSRLLFFPKHASMLSFEWFLGFYLLWLEVVHEVTLNQALLIGISVEILVTPERWKFMIVVQNRLKSEDIIKNSALWSS